MAATFTDATVIAQDAPLGVQLCPTHRPEDAPRYTLAAVDIIPENASRALAAHVRWTYETGHTRYFSLNESVAVYLPAAR